AALEALAAEDLAAKAHLHFALVAATVARARVAVVAGLAVVEHRVAAEPRQDDAPVPGPAVVAPAVHDEPAAVRLRRDRSCPAATPGAARTAEPTVAVVDLDRRVPPTGSYCQQKQPNREASPAQPAY